MSTSIKERPIIFSGPMVRAILAGKKTQTRRVVKDPDYLACLTGDCPHWEQSECDASIELMSPFGKVGDRLWVRETFAITSFGAGVAQIVYAADGKRGNNAGVSDHKLPDRLGTVSPMRMPKHCSRLALEITNVRVERLHAITDEDAIAEGVKKVKDSCYVVPEFGYDNAGLCHSSPIIAYATYWDSLNEDSGHSWESNPWVWVISFKRVER